MFQEKLCSIVSLKCAQIGHKYVHEFTLVGNEDSRIKANEPFQFCAEFHLFQVQEVNPS